MSRPLPHRMPSCPSPLAHVARLGVLAALLPSLGGCVVFEIRDEMTSIREGLGETNDLLRNVNVNLNEVEQELVEVQDGLEPLERLAAIDRSLENLDKHLAAVRTTLRALDDIPFVNLGTEDADEAEAEAEAAGTAAESGDGAAQPTEPGSSGAGGTGGSGGDGGSSGAGGSSGGGG